MSAAPARWVHVFEDANGVRILGVTAEYEAVHWSGRVLHDVEAFHPWLLVWTDGINEWVEPYLEVHVALARFAALIVAAESDAHFVHRDLDVNTAGRRAFEDEVQRFITHVVQD